MYTWAGFCYSTTSLKDKYGLVFNLHKCDVETWSLQCTQTENGLFSEVEDSFNILLYTIFACLKILGTHLITENNAVQTIIDNIILFKVFFFLTTITLYLNYISSLFAFVSAVVLLCNMWIEFAVIL